MYFICIIRDCDIKNTCFF